MFDLFHDVFVFMKKYNNKAKVKDDICTTEIVNKGNNKITKLRAILQRESQNS